MSETFYEQIGGRETIAAIVHRFYQGVATDELLRPMYPEDDLGPAEERFRMFLEQYWGGPTTYSETRGHPRLRMRHAPFGVTTAARDRWLVHFRAALDLGDAGTAELGLLSALVARAEAGETEAALLAEVDGRLATLPAGPAVDELRARRARLSPAPR